MFRSALRFLMPEKSKPAIVVAAYNRPQSLDRLLRSLSVAEYGRAAPIELIISLDLCEQGECVDLAQRFGWGWGRKRLIVRERHLGLRDHILVCGDLSLEYGAIVMLEDDLCVGPGFYTYAVESMRTYENDERIAGISLYSFIFNEFGCFPFVAMDDGFDAYFVQSASSWGQLWTSAQWGSFRQWLEGRPEDFESGAVSPQTVRDWPRSSWKRLFNEYLAEAHKYFVIPRFSVSTNMGDAGTHVKSGVSHFVSPLSLGRRRLRLPHVDRSRARYDAFFELEAGCLAQVAPAVNGMDFEVDFYGQKPVRSFAKEWVLTSRPVDGKARGFGFRFFPPELNMVFNEPGDFFALVRRESLREGRDEAKIAKIRQFFLVS